jgi:transcriptional regulator with XRE-family HTH domain
VAHRDDRSEKALLFGRRLLQAREAVDLTQAELAKMAGVSDATVSRAETGMHMPRPENVEALAQALSRPTWWFFAQADELADLVEDEIVAVFRKVVRGKGTVEAIEHTLARPMRLPTRDQRYLNGVAKEFRDAFQKETGREVSSLSDQELDRLAKQFLEELRRD